jgi:hypothetical protein
VYVALVAPAMIVRLPQAADGAVYHWYAYVPVPPEGFEESTMAWPTSIVAAASVTTPATSNGSTVTVEPVVEVFTKGSGVIVADVVTPVSVTV